MGSKSDFRRKQVLLKALLKRKMALSQAASTLDISIEEAWVIVSRFSERRQVSRQIRKSRSSQLLVQVEHKSCAQRYMQEAQVYNSVTCSDEEEDVQSERQVSGQEVMSRFQECYSRSPVGFLHSIASQASSRYAP